MISMDSTLRSNLSVGMPLDLAVVHAEQYGVVQSRRFESDDPVFRQISEAWSRELRAAFHALPEVPLR